MINLKDLINNYLKNYIVYLLLFFIFTFIGFTILYKIPNKYNSKIELMLNSSDYVPVLSKLIKTDLVLNNIDVIDKYDSIRKSVVVCNDIKSKYIIVKMSNKDKNVLREFTSNYLESIIKYSKELYEEEVYLVSDIDSISVSNSKQFYKFVVFIISLFLSFIISIIVYLYKEIIKYTKYDKKYKAPIIKKIP